jgi:hypothetical protein
MNLGNKDNDDDIQLVGRDDDIMGAAVTTHSYRKHSSQI